MIDLKKIINLTIKKIILILTIYKLFNYYINIKRTNLQFNENYFKIQNKLNLFFNNTKIKPNKIKIAIYAHCIKNGGRARMTTILIKYLNKINIFKIVLFTNLFIEDNEYELPKNTKRIRINKNLIKVLKKNKINILIYELDDIKIISKLNNQKNIKVIFYHHSSTFDWLYDNYTIFKTIYKEFLKSKFVISIVPFESDYLFRKWGINSILISNFMTYEFNNIIPSDLSSKTILMIGRGNSKKKRFSKGIQSMEYIINDIPECELQIISNITRINHLKYLVENLNIKKNVKFVGYISSPDISLKNASLNLFPSITEAFPLVLSETKIYGIPNILLGLDYIYISKGGTVIIYDDTPESLAKESIKILKNINYRKKLGIYARKSMKKFNNSLLLKLWTKLILSIYNGKNYFINLRNTHKLMSSKEAINLINNQLKLLKMRDPFFINLTSKNFENFSFMENIK